MAAETYSLLDVCMKFMMGTAWHTLKSAIVMKISARIAYSVAVRMETRPPGPFHRVCIHNVMPSNCMSAIKMRHKQSMCRIHVGLLALNRENFHARVSAS